MHTEEVFSQLLARRRAELGLTAQDLAQKLGMSAQVLQEWESGSGLPAEVEIAAVATALGMPASWLGEAIRRSKRQAEKDAESGTDSLLESVTSDPVSTNDLPVSLFATSELHTPPEPEIASPPPGPADPTPAPHATTSAPGPVSPDPVSSSDSASLRPTAVSVGSASELGEPEVAAGRSHQVRTWISSVFDRVEAAFNRRRNSTKAPTAVLSYIEDPEQLVTYRVRMVFTAAGVITLVLLLRWALGGLSSAIADLVNTFQTAIS